MEEYLAENELVKNIFWKYWSPNMCNVFRKIMKSQYVIYLLQGKVRCCCGVLASGKWVPLVGNWLSLKVKKVIFVST